MLRSLRVPSRQESRLHTEAAGSAPPDAFGPFRVLHQIGNGALGPVFRAYDQNRDRLVAIKLFRLDLPPERVHQLVGEFEKLIAADLQHPVIATPRGTGIDGNSAYLAQDFAAADSLDIVIREGGASQPAQAVRVAGQLAEALDYAADRHIVHGALHPRDILVSQEDIRIVGLGIARALEHVGAVAPVRRPYAAPERISDGGWDRSADVFSLAAIVFEVLTGKRVSGTGSEAAEGLDALPGVSDVEAVQRVFALALASDPAYRYATATAFTEALRSALGIEIVSTTVESAPKPKAKRRPRLRVVAPAAELPLDEAQEVQEVQEVLEVQAVQEEVQEVQEVEPEAPPVRRPRRRRVPAPTPVAIETVALALSAVEETPAPEPPEEPEERAIELVAEVAPVQKPAEVPVDLAPAELALVEEPVLAFEPEPERIPEPLLAEPAIAESPVAESPDSLFVPPPAHPPSPVWPIGVAAVIGIALGFGAGYTVAIRDRAAAPVTVATAAPPAAAPQPVGKDFTEVAAPVSPKLAVSSTPPKAEPKPAVESAQAKVSPKPPVDRGVAKADGRVLVRSTPSGARVVIDGNDRGQTPATIRELSEGEHRIRIVRDGYAAVERRIVLSSKTPSLSLSVPLARDRKPVSPKLAAETTPAKADRAAAIGTMIIDSRPQGAAVFVDGRPAGHTPLSLPDVRVGSHAVRIERDGYRIWTASVSISAGEPNRVTASLEK